MSVRRRCCWWELMSVHAQRSHVFTSSRHSICLINSRFLINNNEVLFHLSLMCIYECFMWIWWYLTQQCCSCRLSWVEMMSVWQLRRGAEGVLSDLKVKHHLTPDSRTPRPQQQLIQTQIYIIMRIVYRLFCTNSSFYSQTLTENIQLICIVLYKHHSDWFIRLFTHRDKKKTSTQDQNITHNEVHLPSENT